MNTVRQTHRLAVGLGLTALLLLGLAVLYAFFVEPQWVEVTCHALAVDITQPLRIAHLTDLHIREYGGRERRVLSLVSGASPDMVVITGDVVEGPSLEPAREFLGQLRAPLGVWLVRGHEEVAQPAAACRAFFKDVGVNFLENEGKAVRDDVWVVGLDDSGVGKPDIRPALEAAPTAAFKLALFHAPDHFADIAGLFNMGLAGHSHGGQMRLPGVGPLWLPARGRRYVQGWYTENRSQLYVSRGLGTSHISARLFSRPEIAIIELTPK